MTKKTIMNLPKTTIATVIMAVIVYSQGKGYIGQDEANLLAAIMMAVGL